MTLPFARAAAMRRRVFHHDQGFVLHPARQKVLGHGGNARRRAVQDEIEQVDEMDPVGEHHAGIVARAFEAAEASAQDPHLPEFARR